MMTSWYGKVLRIHFIHIVCLTYINYTTTSTNMYIYVRQTCENVKTDKRGWSVGAVVLLLMIIIISSLYV